MKKAVFWAFLAIFVIGLPLTAFAGRRDYIEDVLDEWIDYAEDEGYEIIDWDIDQIEEGYTMTYTLELGRGSYWIVAESDYNILDIDLAVFYEDDYEDGEPPFAEDVMEDNYPMLEFELRRRATVVI
ncbi:MAG TPA: hypothetical protein ENN67_08650, partial [Firmicutes bacterium]|nr:hypothetical protein [Bacillota bacterium]